MNRNVEINIPMFIGIILIIMAITITLVWGIQMIRNLRDENNNKVDSGLQGLDNLININKEDNAECLFNEDIVNIDKNIE